MIRIRNAIMIVFFILVLSISANALVVENLTSYNKYLSVHNQFDNYFFSVGNVTADIYSTVGDDFLCTDTDDFNGCDMKVGTDMYGTYFEQLNTEQDHVNMNYNLIELVENSEFTIAIWLYENYDNNSLRNIMGAVTEEGVNDGRFQVYMDTRDTGNHNEYEYTSFHDGSGGTGIMTGIDKADKLMGNFKLITIIFNGSHLFGMINNTILQVNKTNINTVGITANEDFYLFSVNARGNAQNFFDGRIYQISIWNKTLNCTEPMIENVTCDLNSSLTQYYNDLVILEYPFAPPLDSQPPMITITYPNATTFYTSSGNLDGYCIDQFIDNSTSFITNISINDSYLTKNVSVPLGNFSFYYNTNVSAIRDIEISCTDNASNTNSTQATFTFDVMPPSCNGTDTNLTIPINGTDYTINVTCIDDINITSFFANCSGDSNITLFYQPNTTLYDFNWNPEPFNNTITCVYIINDQVHSTTYTQSVKKIFIFPAGSLDTGVCPDNLTSSSMLWLGAIVAMFLIAIGFGAMGRRVPIAGILGALMFMFMGFTFIGCQMAMGYIVIMSSLAFIALFSFGGDDITGY